MTRGFFGALGLCAAIGLAACTQVDSGAGQDALVSQPWVLETIEGRAITAASHNTVTIETDGNVHGRAGCASFSGRAAFDGNRVVFQNLDLAPSDCVDDTLMAATQFLDTLRSSDRWSLQDRYLLLFREGSIVPTRLLRQPAAPPDTLLADQPAQSAAAQAQ